MYERRKILELFDQQKDEWQARAEAGIESNRKGNAALCVTDRSGAPIAGAQIRVAQKTHHFKFGANLFMLDELETHEKNEAYKEYFKNTFNMATLPFYWDATEPQKGAQRYGQNSPKLYRRPPIDLCIAFCEENGIEPREHALAYEHFFPQWLCGADVATVKKELERRYSEIAERYADKIPTIEVTNEMEWRQGQTAFYDESDYVQWCFQTAERYFPNNQLGINEHTRAVWEDRCRATDKYYAYIEANLLKGARIDAIGMQYHLFYAQEDEYEKTRLTLNPASLYKHMDLYAEFGKPLQVTEVTVPAYSNAAEDELLQAETIEKLYTIWFSHPNVEQIIYWNLADGYAHVKEATPETIRESQGNMALGENKYYGGLLRFDLSPKPAYHTLHNLIHRVWHTDLDLVSDGSGRADFRGFYGIYNVTVSANGRETTVSLDLSKNGDNTVSVIL